MKLLQQITLERSLFEPDFRGPKLIGRENDPPVICTSDFDPDILIFRDRNWQILTSCHRDAPDTLWDMEPSPYGILLSQLKADKPYNRAVQSVFLDPLSGTPRFPPLVGLSVWEYLANGTLLCKEDSTQMFICTSPDGTLLWRSSVIWNEDTRIRQDNNYIYFQDEKQIQVYDLQGQAVGAFFFPADLAPRDSWIPYLSFSENSLHIEGINREQSHYMAWDCTKDSIRSQSLSDLSSLPFIWRVKSQKENILFISSLYSDQYAGEGTQCCLLHRNAPAAPVPLFSYWEREFSGAEICWLDDETFAFVQYGHKHSSFYVYSVRGECLVDKTNLPGFLWMDALFSSGGLLYIQTHSSTDKGKTLYYHFSVYQI